MRHTVCSLAFYATFGATNNMLHKHEIVALKCVLILILVKGIDTGNVIRSTEMKTSKRKILLLQEISIFDWFKH